MEIDQEKFASVVAHCVSELHDISNPECTGHAVLGEVGEIQIQLVVTMDPSDHFVPGDAVCIKESK